MTNSKQSLSVEEADQRRRDAITAWWERESIRKFIAAIKARSRSPLEDNSK